MRARCSTPGATAYDRYGGRGVKVCERWADFRNFAADMGPRPAGMSLDRIDNDGDYSPENCRWATRIEQQRNRRGNTVVEINGEKRCVTEWCELYGISTRSVYLRIQHYGWDMVKAITAPKGRHNHALK